MEDILEKLFKNPQIAGELNTLFEEYQDNNLGGNGGAMDLSRYMVNPVNRMIYQNGGVANPPQAFLGGLFKDIGKGAKRFIKKPLKTLGEGLKGGADWGLGILGAGDVIQDSFVDRSSFLSGANSILGTAARTGLDFVAPGAGTALSAIGGAANNASNQAIFNKEQEQNMSIYNSSAQKGMLELLEILNGGFTGGGLQSFFENGGIVDAVPEGMEAIQTETYRGKAEKVVLPDGMIADVNATTTHEKMDRGQVTDVVPSGSYVASSRPEMEIKREELDNIIFGYESLPYEEHRKGAIPTMITAASIVPEKKKKLLPSEYAGIIKDTFAVVDDGDMFVRSANTENMKSRQPYLQALVQMGEVKRLENEPEEYKYGGYVAPRRASSGLIAGLGSALGILGGVTTGIAGLANVSAQKKALKEQQQRLGELRNNLQNMNNQGTAAGIAGQLAQETSLPDLNLDFSRLENFNTGVPQSFIDAQANTRTDVAGMLDRLGNRGGVAALANITSASTSARNTAAQNAFNYQRGLDFDIASTITNGRNDEAQYNNALRQQEVSARNNVFNNIAGQLQGNFQNNATIESQAFTANSQMALQRAGLTGQGAAVLGNSLAGIGGAMNSGAEDIAGLLKQKEVTQSPLSPNFNMDEISANARAEAFPNKNLPGDSPRQWSLSGGYGGYYAPRIDFTSGRTFGNTYIPENIPLPSLSQGFLNYIKQ